MCGGAPLSEAARAGRLLGNGRKTEDTARLKSREATMVKLAAPA